MSSISGLPAGWRPYKAYGRRHKHHDIEISPIYFKIIGRNNWKDYDRVGHKYLMEDGSIYPRTHVEIVTKEEFESAQVIEA